MAAGTLVIGSYLSPYVRKVLVCLDIKGIGYQIDPIVPYFGNDDFSRLSPVRRIPVLIDDLVTLPDSTAICEYLDERYPDPPLLPATARARGRARWLEEYADTRMGEVFIWRLFNQRVIAPHVWHRPTDEPVVARALDTEIPAILDYLETELPREGYLFDLIGTADVAIATFFRNAAFAGFSLDAARWPRTAAFVARVLAHPGFRSLEPFEALCLRTPIAKQREVLGAAGAPIAAQTFAAQAPRPGILSI